QDANAAIARLNAATAMQDLASCDLIIEAIIESVDAKLAVFTELEQIVGPDVILASNTSSIPIGAIAAGCQHRERIAGMHFFNPVPLMQLVEIIPAPDTRSEVTNTLVQTGRRMGRTPVV